LIIKNGGKPPAVLFNSTTNGRRYSTLQEIQTLNCSGGRWPPKITCNQKNKD